MEMSNYSAATIRCEPHTPPVIPATSIAQELEHISNLLDLSEGTGMAADTLEKIGFVLSPTQPITPKDGIFALFILFHIFWSSIYSILLHFSINTA